MVPLAEILRPTTLDGYIGQQHLVGKGAPLRALIDSGRIPSMILWGPPGIGKTTLAAIISHTLQRPFYTLSAISSGVKEVREVIDKAKAEEGSILFIDEIHRFSKSQQDSLLGAVERGIVTLIGATTENPSFEVISALLSRCQVYALKEFGTEELQQLVNTAVEHYASQGRKVEVKETEALFRISGGDARKLLNAIELVVNNSGEDDVMIDNAGTARVIQQNLAYYDKQGVFIARRMLIFASEDIGNSNPNALLLANACFEAVTKIGYPECRITLSQCAVYLASSVKSNSTYMALANAQQVVRQTGDLPVPLHIRNAPTKLMKQLGYGDGYKYAHDYVGNFVEQEFLPDRLKGTKFYEPGQNAREEETRRQLRARWGQKYGY